MLNGFKYYVRIVLMLYCKTLLLPLRCDTSKVRVRCGDTGRFKYKGWVSYRCNYMLVFLKYKYNVKKCMYTVSPFYQIIRFSVHLI